MKALDAVTKTMKALPVAQERAQMSPERKREQRNSVLTALVAFTVGAAIIAWAPWPWWTGTIPIAYGLYAFDNRAFTDFLKLIGQLARTIRNLKKEEVPRGD